MKKIIKNRKVIIGVVTAVMLITAITLLLLRKDNKSWKLLNTDNTEKEQGIQISYKVNSADASKAKVVIQISDSENGIKQIDCPNGNQLKAATHKEQIALDMEVNIGEEYKFLVTTEKDEKVEKSIMVDNYYTSYEICNITPYGYDVYVYGVSDLVNDIKYPTWTAENGQDDIRWLTAKRVGDRTYYGRVNTDLHNNEPGEYITHIYIYNKFGSTIATLGGEANVIQKNTNITNVTADSLIAGVRDNDIPTGYCDMTVNGKMYNLEVINIDDFYRYDKEKSQYEMRDFIAGTYNVSRTAVIKSKENLQIDGSVTTSVGNIDGYDSLTKVKGLFICANGTLTNNGTINMTARGTYNTQGEDIYLWKNSDESYEIVPATGATGGSTVIAAAKGKGTSGNNGTNGTSRQTGGGGSGDAIKSNRSTGSYSVYAGAGSSGTSYSGGTGGGRFIC